MNHRIQTISNTAAVPRKVHTVLVPGASEEGPEELVEPLISLLIDIERRGLNIVLHAQDMEDLDSPVARICRYVYSTDQEVLTTASGRWGAEQVCTDLASLPVPPSRTLRRRLYNVLKRRGG